MSYIPLRRRPLEKGRGRVYLDRMSGQWFADYRTEDGTKYAVWASDIADGNEWCRLKAVGLSRLSDRMFEDAVMSRV